MTLSVPKWKKTIRYACWFACYATIGVTKTLTNIFTTGYYSHHDQFVHGAHYIEFIYFHTIATLPIIETTITITITVTGAWRSVQRCSWSTGSEEGTMVVSFGPVGLDDEIILGRRKTFARTTLGPRKYHDVRQTKKVWMDSQGCRRQTKQFLNWSNTFYMIKLTGFGDNIRVLEWILGRADGIVPASGRPVGGS